MGRAEAIGSGLTVVLLTAAAARVLLARDGDAPAGATGVRVDRVVDSDTVVVSTGGHVRLIGIDTPERGECGYEAATEALQDRVEGREVVLRNPASVEDRDRYDRLLRYVDAIVRRRDRWCLAVRT